MHSQSYDIQRWDGIYNDTTTAQPALYVAPDPQILGVARQNQFRIPVKITDTDSPYDHVVAWATVQPSETTAGYRPNFQAQTGFIVIVPEIQWNGYPRQLGRVHVLVDTTEGQDADIATRYLSQLNGDPESDLVLPCLTIVIVFAIVMLLIDLGDSRRKNQYF